MAYEDTLSAQAIDVLRYGFAIRLQQDQVDNALTLSFELAQRRADGQYGREPTPIEVAMVGSLLCWYPLKGPPSKSYADAIGPVQTELFQHGLAAAETSEVVATALEFLVNASTDELLNALVAIADDEPTTGPVVA